MSLAADHAERLVEEYARRASFAFSRWVDNKWPDRPNQSDLGIAVAKRQRRKRPYSQPAVRGWLTGAVPNNLETMRALADELGVDKTWFYFGEGEEPPGWEAVPKLPSVREKRVRRNGER